MTERKADRDLLGIVVAVADKDILAIGNTLVIARKVQIAGVVLQTKREGLSQMSAGVGLAVQQLVGGLTDALAAEIQFQNGRDAVGPRQLDRAARCARTTTTWGWTFAISSIRRFWQAGSSIEVRSYPSDSNDSGKPAKTTATSAFCAA